MNDDRSLERAARSWIEAGPTQAPESAVAAALQRIEITSQDRDLRIPRTFALLPAPARLATAALIGVLALGGGSLVMNRLLQNDAAVSPPPSSPPVSVKPTTSAALTQPWALFELGGTVGEPHEIWLVHPDGTDLHELGPDSGGKAAFDISPDGTRVVYTSVGPSDVGESQIFEVSIDGGAPRLVSTDCPGPLGECSEMNPAYSPDGRRIAFVRVGPAEAAVIGIRDLETGEVTLLEATRTPDQLTGQDGILSQPTWSPDGDRLSYSQWFYSRHGSGAQAHVYVIADDGTGLVDLSLDVAANDPDWSPDGSTLVFATVSSRLLSGIHTVPSAIYVVDPDGSDLRAIVEASDDEPGGFAPSWTPDGSRILYWDRSDETWVLLDPSTGAGERLFAGSPPVDNILPLVARLQPTP